jgi:HEAT repeat protein
METNDKTRFLMTGYRRYAVAILSGAMIAASGCQEEQKTSASYNYTKEAPPPPGAPAAPPVKAMPLDESLHAAALGTLINAEDSNRPGIRANAIEALQETSPRDGADAAIKGLTDADPGVRFSACMAVGELKLASAHQRLLDMHDSDPSRVVQVGVRFALHRLGDTRYSHDLEKFARDPDPEIRGKTARSAAQRCRSLGAPASGGVALANGQRARPGRSGRLGDQQIPR